MLRRSDLFGPILPSPFELKLNAERIRAKEIKNKIPRGYIATPGTGPKGETCRTCQHVVRVRLWGEQRLRCGLNQAKWKKTNRSRVIPTSPACSQWERGQEVYAKKLRMRARYGHNVGKDVHRESILSDCENYLYVLRRVWQTSRARVLFIILNPTGRSVDQDNVVTSACIRIARAHGFGSLEIVSLFAFRSDNGLQFVGIDPVGPKNRIHLRDALRRCDVVVCAWGTHFMTRHIVTTWAFRQRRRMPVMDSTLREIALAKKVAFCLGINEDRHPLHPMDAPVDQSFEVFLPFRLDDSNTVSLA